MKAASLSVALTGRWCALDSNGAAIAPTAAQTGIYLIYEGTAQHLGTPTDFAAGVSTKTLPPDQINQWKSQIAAWTQAIQQKQFEMQQAAAAQAAALMRAQNPAAPGLPPGAGPGMIPGAGGPPPAAGPGK